MTKSTKLTGHYTGIQVGYWAAMAVFNSLYVPILRERGFSGNEISILLALRYGIVVLVQPLLAGFADRHVKTVPLKYLVAVINCVGLAASAVFAVTRPGVLLTGFLIALNGCAMGLLVAFNDSLAMQYVNQGVPINYSFARAFGSVAFAVSSLVLGFLTSAFGIECVTYAQTLILLVKLVIVLTFAKCGTAAKKDCRTVHSSWYLLRHYPEFTVFLMAVIFLYVGNVMYLSFVMDLVEELGGDSTNLGVIHFIMSISELPLAFTIAKIRKKIPNHILLVVSTVFIVIRMLLVALSVSIVMLSAVQLLNMLGFGVYFSSSVLFVNEIIPKEDQVKGQSLMGAVSSAGLAGMLGSLISGGLSNYYGVGAVMKGVVGCMAAGMAVMTAAVCLRRKREKKLNRKGDYMKKLEIIVKPEKLEVLQTVLEDSGVTGLMVTNLFGYGNQKGVTQIYRGSVYDASLLAKVKVETVVTDELSEKLKKKIVEEISTGHFGDGKIFVYDIDDVVRIRTGEHGKNAI